MALPGMPGARLRASMLAALLAISVLIGLAITATASGSPIRSGFQVLRPAAVAGQLTASRGGAGEDRTHAALHRAIPKTHEDRAYVYDGAVTPSTRTLSRHSSGVSLDRPVEPVHREDGRGVRLRAPPVLAAEDSAGAVRSFAHGTSPSSAAGIAENGLSESAARAQAGGGQFATPGSFHTVEINPANPSEALDTAFGYGLLKSGTPNVVVSELSEDVFQGLLGRGLASVEKVPGLGEQTVFHPGGYDIFNQYSTRYVINPYE